GLGVAEAGAGVLELLVVLAGEQGRDVDREYHLAIAGQVGDVVGGAAGGAAAPPQVAADAAAGEEQQEEDNGDHPAPAAAPARGGGGGTAGRAGLGAPGVRLRPGRGDGRQVGEV